MRMGIHFGEAEERRPASMVSRFIGPLGWQPSPTGVRSSLSATAALASSRLAATRRLPSGSRFAPVKDLGRAEQIFQLHGEGLPFDFPPLRSLDNPELPNNLPAQSATFVGRDLELADVRHLIEFSRLVTLTGAGGSGKTRLGSASGRRTPRRLW